MFEAFKYGELLKDSANIYNGLQTSDNNRFLRFWFEIEKNKFGLNFSSCNETKNSPFKWFPFNSGGSFKKWYGNQYYVVNWENDGYELRNFKKSLLRNFSFYFKECLTWSKLTSSATAFRFFPKGFIFGGASGAIFSEMEYEYLIGLLNSNISKIILSFISPTLNFEAGHISSIPIIFEDNNQIRIYVQVYIIEIFLTQKFLIIYFKHINFSLFYIF